MEPETPLGHEEKPVLVIVEEPKKEVHKFPIKRIKNWFSRIVKK